MITSKMKSTKIAPVDVKPTPGAPMSDSSLVTCLVPNTTSNAAVSTGIMTSYVEGSLGDWPEAYIRSIWAIEYAIPWVDGF